MVRSPFSSLSQHVRCRDSLRKRVHGAVDCPRLMAFLPRLQGRCSRAVTKHRIDDNSLSRGFLPHLPMAHSYLVILSELFKTTSGAMLILALLCLVVLGFNHAPVWGTLLRDPLYPHVSAVRALVDSSARVWR